ncbi:uncharacterized protein DEA37_0012367 [Paragonimus westermani]|uniref:Uncharacterized protein n=1 Tax=Paragonimus westermani TaxID=34504 RepID=A0A5J4P3C5_9TREM|nr:uncharacterized protein DEA37_0012367 [Paragonimus westermani]
MFTYSANRTGLRSSLPRRLCLEVVGAGVGVAGVLTTAGGSGAGTLSAATGGMADGSSVNAGFSLSTETTSRLPFRLTVKVFVSLARTR